MSEEAIDDILSDAGVRIEYNRRIDKWRFQACYNKVYIPIIVGDWQTDYDVALGDALAFVESY